MKEIIALRLKKYSRHLTDDYHVHEWEKDKEICNRIRNWIRRLQIVSEIWHNNPDNTAYFRSEAYNVFTEKVKKTVLSGNGNKRRQTSDGIISYPYDTGPGRVWKE